MPADFKHCDFKQHLPLWEQIGDCIEGEQKIKKGKTKYLPKPNASDGSPANADRYKAYLQRAVFHNVTGRTLGNMLGQVFTVAPTCDLPPRLEALEADVDGGGVALAQQAKKALGYVLAFSRAAILTDYPRTEGLVTLEDEEQRGIRPKVILFDPRKIINWRVEQRGAMAKLVLVVIEEPRVTSDDGFEEKTEIQYRALRLVGDVYTVEIYRLTGGAWTMAESVIPQDASGKPFAEIPLCFIGAEANSPEVEKPLLIDISNLNLAHYRDSADYQEAVYMVGQPTPWVAGLSQSWVDNVLKGEVQLGSRSIIPLPEGATAGLLQASANTLPKEAMDQKEQQMQALGAKMIERIEVAKTATEAGINEASETSILATCADNVTAAYNKALRWAGQFVGIDLPEDELAFELNTDFAIARMSADERSANREDYNSGLITWEEARDKLKRGGAAYLDDEEAKDAIETEAENDLAKAKAEMMGGAEATLAVEAGKAALGGAVPPPAKKAAKKAATKRAVNA